MKGALSISDALAIAKLLLGEPSARLSLGDAIRFGRHGQVTILLGPGKFYNADAIYSGDLLELVQRMNFLPRAHATAWLQAQGGGA
jgi:hypothetical protein